VRAAGIHRFGDQIESLELPGPRALRPDEVLIDVRACGVGNWDEFVRTGNWDLGIRPPMALGVEAAGAGSRFPWPRGFRLSEVPRRWPRPGTVPTGRPLSCGPEGQAVAASS
jgi:hypothetical protein